MKIGGRRIEKGAIKADHIPDGEITYNKLATDTIQFVTHVTLFANKWAIPIDSTGVKLTTGGFILDSELLKHAKAAYLEASMLEFGATDSVVAIELYDPDNSTVVASINISNNTYLDRSSDILSNLQGYVGKTLVARANVTTASATAGATAKVMLIRLTIVNGVS